MSGPSVPGHQQPVPPAGRRPHPQVSIVVLTVEQLKAVHEHQCCAQVSTSHSVVFNS